MTQANSSAESASTTPVESKLEKAVKTRAEDRRTMQVDQLRKTVYEQTDLSDYSLKDRIFIKAAASFFSMIIRICCATARWQVVNNHPLDLASRDSTFIFASWHTGILGATWFWRNRGIVVMSSKSRDAEFTGRVIKRFGYGTARGSATRGARRAMIEMAACLSNGISVGMTIDGPRGPAFQAKPGAVTLARHTGQAILPFHVSFRRFVSMPSWDRLQIPLPFTKAACFIGEPITVSREGNSTLTRSSQDELQTTLNQLRLDADEWRLNLLPELA